MATHLIRGQGDARDHMERQQGLKQVTVSQELLYGQAKACRKKRSSATSDSVRPSSCRHQCMRGRQIHSECATVHVSVPCKKACQAMSSGASSMRGALLGL